MRAHRDDDTLLIAFNCRNRTLKERDFGKILAFATSRTTDNPQGPPQLPVRKSRKAADCARKNGRAEGIALDTPVF